jgi:amphi-Trp domain-containing protein
MSKEKIEFSGGISTDDAASYLESLAAALRKRTVLLESGDASVTVAVGEHVKVGLEVSADAGKGKSNIDISMSWRARRNAVPVASPALAIAAGTTPSAQPAEHDAVGNNHDNATALERIPERPPAVLTE